MQLKMWNLLKNLNIIILVKFTVWNIKIFEKGLAALIIFSCIFTGLFIRSTFDGFSDYLAYARLKKGGNKFVLFGVIYFILQCRLLMVQLLEVCCCNEMDTTLKFLKRIESHVRGGIAIFFLFSEYHQPGVIKVFETHSPLTMTTKISA